MMKLWRRITCIIYSLMHDLDCGSFAADLVMNSTLVSSSLSSALNLTVAAVDSSSTSSTGGAQLTNYTLTTAAVDNNTAVLSGGLHILPACFTCRMPCLCCLCCVHQEQSLASLLGVNNLHRGRAFTEFKAADMSCEYTVREQVNHTVQACLHCTAATRLTCARLQGCWQT